MTESVLGDAEGAACDREGAGVALRSGGRVKEAPISEDLGYHCPQRSAIGRCIFLI